MGIKMNGVNLIFNGVSSVNGFQSSMLKKIEERLTIEKCVLIDCCNDGSDQYDERYIRVSYDVCAHSKYKEVYNLESMLSVDGKTMEAMQPYESMTIKMLMRMYEVSFLTYDEAKRLYLQHLRFWNHMIETHKINYIVITAVPHHTHQYLLYALARIKKITLCVITVCQISLRKIVCDNLDTIGEKITLDYYQKWRGKENVVLPDDVEEFYNRKKYNNLSGETCMMTVQEKKAMLQVIKSIFYQDVSRERYFKAVKKAIRSILSSEQKVFSKKWKDSIQEVMLLHRARKKMRSMVSPDYFDKMAVIPDIKKRYIVYFLHYQPEATTMPQAGVFVEQEQAVRILAESLRGTGIELYVKEHFVQQKRDREFYDELAEMEGITLVRSDVGSKEIIMNSLAVATCTGTVTLEAVINGIPAMVFGKVGLDEGPGIYPVASAADCKKVLSEIQESHFCIQQNEVKNYLKAFSDNTFRAFTGNPAKVPDTITLQESSDNMADAIVNFYYDTVVKKE